MLTLFLCFPESALHRECADEHIDEIPVGSGHIIDVIHYAIQARGDPPCHLTVLTVRRNEIDGGE